MGFFFGLFNSNSRSDAIRDTDISNDLDTYLPDIYSFIGRKPFEFLKAQMSLTDKIHISLLNDTVINKRDVFYNAFDFTTFQLIELLNGKNWERIEIRYRFYTAQVRNDGNNVVEAISLIFDKDIDYIIAKQVFQNKYALIGINRWFDKTKNIEICIELDKPSKIFRIIINKLGACTLDNSKRFNKIKKKE